MHRLRYHAAPAAAPPTDPSRVEAPPPAPMAGPGGSGPRPGSVWRSVAVSALMSVVGLIAVGFYAHTRSEADGAVATTGTTGAIGATGATGTTVATGPTAAELTAAVHRAAFNAADFPAGWAADPSKPDDNAPDPSDKVMADCLGLPYDNAPNDADSSFSSGQRTAGSQFQIAPSLDRARADFAALGGAGAPACFEQGLRMALDGVKPAGGTLDVKVTRVDPAPAPAAESAAFDAAVIIHQGRVVVPMVFRTVMIQHGRIEATLIFSSAGTAGFPAELQRSLTSAVVNRLAG